MRPQPLHDLSSNGKQKRTAYAVICAHTLFGPTSAHKNNHGAGHLTFPDVSKRSPTISRGAWPCSLPCGYHQCPRNHPKVSSCGVWSRRSSRCVAAFRAIAAPATACNCFHEQHIHPMCTPAAHPGFGSMRGARTDPCSSLASLRIGQGAPPMNWGWVWGCWGLCMCCLT